MKVEIEVADHLLKAAIVSGLEGGIQYWAINISLGRDTNEVILSERESADSYREFKLSTYAWGEALKVMAVKAPFQLGRLLAGEGDRDTGDALIQCACFGELKYG